MRALRVLVVVMGVLIVLGTAALVAAVIYRAPGRRPALPAAEVPGSVAARAVLAEPEGTRIAGVALSGGRLAVSLQGGGPDRVVLLDLASGQVVGAVSLAR